MLFFFFKKKLSLLLYLASLQFPSNRKQTINDSSVCYLLAKPEQFAACGVGYVTRVGL